MRTVATRFVAVGFLAVLAAGQARAQSMSKSDTMAMAKHDGMSMGTPEAMARPGTMVMQHGKVLQNLDRKAVALQGFDPVSFFTATPSKGTSEYSSQYQGATYLFASVDHKATFDRDPGHYAPQFGGYCAYAASKGHTASVEIDAYQIVDGRLLMQNSKSVRELFNQDTAGNLKQADQNWPGIIDREGKPATP